MSNANVVAAEKVILIHYTLKDDEGAVLDSSEGAGPMPYLHGANNIVPGLEKALEGLGVGDEFEVSIAPKDGYGEKNSSGAQAVHKREFPKDATLSEGMAFRAGANGEVVLYITKIQGAYVYVDTDHPLAGKTLHFSGSIARIRPANETEKAHGHPHGPDGTHHH